MGKPSSILTQKELLLAFYGGIGRHFYFPERGATRIVDV